MALKFLNDGFFDGKVGIGTDDPSERLHVNSGGRNIVANFESTDSKAYISFKDSATTDANTVFLGAEGNNMTFYAGSASSQRMRISSAGDVGIDETSNSAGDTTNGVPKFQVKTTTAVLGEFPLAARFTTSSDAGDNSGVSVLINSGNDRGLMISAGREVGNTAKASLNIVGNDGVEIETITLLQRNEAGTTADVGIGTTSPATKLQVTKGSSGFTGSYNGRTSAVFENSESAGSAISIMSKNTGYSGVFFGDENLETAGQILYAHTDNSFRLLNNGGSLRMLINSDGDVGIGTTTPLTLLNLEGVKNTSIITLESTTNDTSWSVGDKIGAINFYSADDSGAGEGVKASMSYEVSNGATGATNALVFNTAGTTTGTNNTERMRIDSVGNVGIGTDDPTEKLEVAGNSITRSKTRGLGTNYATPEGWVAGAASTFNSQPGFFGGDFLNNGPSAENKVEFDNGPFGSRELVWMTVPEVIDNPDGGWNKAMDGFDNSTNNGFMSVVYVRRDSGTAAGSFFHGCSGTATNNLDGTANTNPYFSIGMATSNFPADVWCVSIGIIYASSDASTTPSTLGGIYRLDTGVKFSNLTTFRQKSGVTTQQQRVYHFYSTSTTSQLDFARPGFYILDGSEPTLSELTAGAAGGDDVFWSADGNNIYNDNTGNVGIGTTNPRAKLATSFNGGHTTGNIGIQDSSLDLYNPVQANTDEKGSILTFSDNYFNNGNYTPTTRAAIKGGTDTVGNTGDGFLSFYTDSGAANTMPERMRIDKDGNVGIGTTSPAFSLDVNGDTRTDCVWFRDNTSSSPSSVAGFYRPSLGAVAYGFNTNEFFRIAANGKVGIGTTSPKGKLHILDGAAATYTPNGESDTLVIESGVAGGVSLIGTGAGGNQKQSITFGTTADVDMARIIYDPNNSFLRIGTTTANNYVAFSSGNDAEAIRILGNQNVGIGTNDPDSKFEINDGFNINGNLRLGTNDIPGAGGWARGMTTLFANTSTGKKSFVRQGLLGDGDDLDYWWHSMDTATTAPWSNNAFRIYPNNNIVAGISGGKVGIGTITPSQLLHVKAENPILLIQDNSTATLNASSTLRLAESDAAGDADVYWDIKQAPDAVGTNLQINHSTLGNALTILSSGNVGIGTTNPEATLEPVNISATSDGDGSASQTLSGQDSILLSTKSGTFEETSGAITWRNGPRRRAMITGVNEAADGDGDILGLAFYTQGTDGSGDFFESMRIAHSGNVGIGTNSPTAPLHIAGIQDPRVKIQDLDGTNQFASMGHNNGDTTFVSRNNTADGKFSWYGGGGGTITPRMTLDLDGKLGIGTDSFGPTAPLQVVGIAEYTNNTTALAAGLTAGAFYRTGDLLKVVH